MELTFCYWTPSPFCYIRWFLRLLHNKDTQYQCAYHIFLTKKARRWLQVATGQFRDSLFKLKYHSDKQEAHPCNERRCYTGNLSESPSHFADVFVCLCTHPQEYKQKLLCSDLPKRLEMEETNYELFETVEKTWEQKRSHDKRSSVYQLTD